MTNSTRAPSRLPSLLTLMAHGHTTTRVLLFSFLPACLSVCLFVRPSVRPSISFRVPPFRVCLLCLHLLPHRGNLFSDAAFANTPSSEPPSPALPYLPRAPSLRFREMGLLVFCARHVTESPRGRLCCRGRRPSSRDASYAGFLVYGLFARVESGTPTL